MAQQVHRELRAAHNQALFRSVNERMEELNQTFDDLEPYGAFMCECFSTDCHEPIEMTLEEYEAVRARPNRFAVVADPSHVDPQVEEVVNKGKRYWTVDKKGSAAALARELDERSTPRKG